ncbi:MAG: bi-domain-containing oxidoreductase [Candidimonas sp.]|nr:bi-domain-containing oxidoreductase [Candidimonas sp.]
MKQVLIKGGGVVVEQVPAPKVGNKNLLVRVTHSCISVGTEMAGVRMSGLPLYQRALKQPENVKRVLEMMRDQGVKRTLDRVSGKLSAGSATGYSASGIVVDVGIEVQGYARGDRVACAGAGIANHAEYIDVPVNLAVKLPESVSGEVASTVTLGAIAMQGVRRAQPTLGETVVVVGLGILGQLTVQMLAANGCRVVGTDVDPSRIDLAIQNGMDIGIDPAAESYIDVVLRHTDGMGADAVIITAAAASHQIISEAMQACRKKGRVVLVGDVGLNLNRSDFYKKELDFLISSSYGPGRYDPMYEENGQDYPLPYVRWTENRNMQAYIALLSTGRIKLDLLYQKPYSVDNAPEAYEALKGDSSSKPLLVLLEYPTNSDLPSTTVRISRNIKPTRGAIRVGIVGASSFAQGMHLPNLVKLPDRYALRAVMSRTGANARAVATQYELAYCTTEYEALLSDPEIDLVMITTRHDLHGAMVLEALRAGKHVFVEKPLALSAEELELIERFYSEKPDGPMLMVGFNRRFSPAIQRAIEVLKGRTTPLIANYQMNAGYIPLEHWVHGPEGGGRNIGEACHIYDLFTALVGTCAVESISAAAISPTARHWLKNDNFVATLKYADGSVCTLTYTALGDKSYPKERLDIFADGKVIVMDDYKSLQIHGGKHRGWNAQSADKGQFNELKQLAASLATGDAWPISLEEQILATRISFEVERLINGGARIPVEANSDDRNA